MSYDASSNYFLTRLLYYKHKHDKKDKSFYGTTYLFLFYLFKRNIAKFRYPANVTHTRYGINSLPAFLLIL